MEVARELCSAVHDRDRASLLSVLASKPEPALSQKVPHMLPTIQSHVRLLLLPTLSLRLRLQPMVLYDREPWSYTALSQAS